MHHGGEAGPSTCMGKSISHAPLLHVPDKGKEKKPSGSSDTTRVASEWVLLPTVKGE